MSGDLKLFTEQTHVVKVAKCTAAGDRIGRRRFGAKWQHHLLGSTATASRANQGPRGSVKSGRFEALLNKLMAVRNVKVFGTPIFGKLSWHCQLAALVLQSLDQHAER
jgi:hypothetical protein